ncbi:hypothetical protein [Alteromonas sp. KUL49]|uniref:hypothetical protein n=1 Tax=Alteromonas sp. KUL49 TaxID=2480798 RepID=UPI00102F289E|nr:hypothetical protein [Alteromonas sp. KUL49]TAP34972.1 hypothetical protein EYS00_19165 [Alteromonas sp. KUL49]GEA13517.1 hypothetical protein KUL49_38920 [Alteromonas sp. KUL49]
MKTSIIAASLLTSVVISQPVSAQESVLENLLTNVVTHAFEVTSFEIENNVYQAIASASFHFELDGDEAKGTVSVTDIAEAKQPEDEAISHAAE